MCRQKLFIWGYLFDWKRISWGRNRKTAMKGNEIFRAMHALFLNNRRVNYRGIGVIMTDYDPADYSFWGLWNNNRPPSPVDIITSMAYLICLVPEGADESEDLGWVNSALGCLFDIEEQTDSAKELLERQSEFFPANVHPQTPVMVTAKRWSPIETLLRHNWTPKFLVRESKTKIMACASGTWEFGVVPKSLPLAECRTSEQLFWHVISQVEKKGRERNQLLSVILKPGWSYEDNLESPFNLSQEEAARADRVLWQRTPRPSGEI